MNKEQIVNKAALVADCLHMQNGEIKKMHWPGFGGPREIIPIIDIEVNPLRKRCGLEPIYGVSGIQNEPENFSVWCGFF